MRAQTSGEFIHGQNHETHLLIGLHWSRILRRYLWPRWTLSSVVRPWLGVVGCGAGVWGIVDTRGTRQLIQSRLNTRDTDSCPDRRVSHLSIRVGITIGSMQ